MVLAGAPNFRAVGRVVAADGRRLREGVLFRSGGLTDLTDQDLEAIESTGIRLICDLRSAAERHRFPSRWPEHAPARVITMPAAMDGEAGLKPLVDRLTREPGPEGAYRAMIDLYGALPRLVAPALAEMAEDMITGSGVPLLVHCHVGKDRTGVVIALLLAALGVERDGIFTDYLETGHRIDIAAETRHIGRLLETILGTAIDPRTLDHLGRADQIYLEAMFAAVDRQWGGLVPYFEAIGLGESGREALRSRLLE